MIRKRTSLPVRRVAQWLQIVLWGVGLVALGYYAFVLIGARLYQAEQARSFDQATGPKDHSKVPDVLPGDQARLPAASQYPMDGKVVGRIQIARLGLSAMIVEGVKEPDLRRAVGHIPGTALPGQFGNIGLAGHRDTFFRPIRNIHPNDVIELVTLEGRRQYHVTSTLIVGPDDVWVLDPTPKESLTLVTCYPFDFVGPAPKRYIVKAERTA